MSPPHRAFLLTFAFLAAPVAAAEPEIPEHVVRNIKASLRGADAVAVVTVLSVEAPSRGRRAPQSVEVQVERALLGELPHELRLPAARLFPSDLFVGARLVVSLRAASRAGEPPAWTPTGRYELVIRGAIREVPERAYLERAAQEIAARASTRALTQPPKARQSLVAAGTGP